MLFVNFIGLIKSKQNKKPLVGAKIVNIPNHFLVSLLLNGSGFLSLTMKLQETLEPECQDHIITSSSPITCL